MGARAIEIHCCLLSKQLLPNLLPLLDAATRPDTVVLLVSADMGQEFETIARMCKRFGISIDRRDISAWDFQNICEATLDALAAYDGKRIGLNVTGGTKLMALGAFEACRENVNEIFYIDTKNDRRITLLPQSEDSPLQDVLKVDDCLRAYGYTPVKKDTYPLHRETRALTEHLVKHSSNLGEPLRTLNYYAREAERNLSVTVDTKHLKWDAFMEILGLFKEGGFLNLDSDCRITFPGEAERFFVNGGWLELHVYAVCSKLLHEKKIRDLAANITVTSETGVTNELDVAFTARNRLFIIECKTRFFGKDEGLADNAINKLSALKPELSGVYGKTMFVSYMRLREAQKARCKKWGIDLVQAGEINNLQARIENCIKQS